jgi:hypothetical protein
MDIFASALLSKVVKMANFSPDVRNSADDNFIRDKDLLMEQILANLNNTPIGQVLKRIASLPEVRREKVLDIRRRLTEGHYDFNERLDMALDKVLDDLIA